jgi:hypothetical protein
MFGRRKRSQPPAAIERGMSAARYGRLAGTTYQIDQLPITQGLAQLHSDVIASAELYAEDVNGNRVVNTPSVLEQPDPDEDRMVTLHKLVQSLWWEGNAYALVDFGSRFDVSIKVQNPNAVAYVPYADPGRDLEVLAWRVHGMSARTDQVNHWKLNDDPRRGPLGQSPLRKCWIALENYAGAYSYLARFYASGGNPSMILRSTVPLDPTQALEAQAQWIAGGETIRVLDPQWQVEQGPAAQDIAQTIAVLDFAAAEVCRATNVAPSIGNVISQGTMTYSNVRDELKRWTILSLRPTWLRRIEDGFTRLLAPGLRARFDLDTLLEGVEQLAGDAPAAMSDASPAPAPLRAVS